jgi:hypothetical protein
MPDELEDLPAFGSAQTEAESASDLPPDPIGLKPMSGRKRKGPGMSNEGSGASLPTDQDGILANDLIVLVSTLEQYRAELAGLRRGGEPAEVLEIIGNMVDLVAKAAMRHLPLESSDPALAAALAEAKGICDSTEELKPEFDGSAVRAVLRFFGKSGLSHAERRYLFRRLVGRIHEVLERFFVQFNERFTSPLVAQDWSQTYPLFLDELDQVASRLECP